MKKLNKLAVAGMAAILFATNLAGGVQAYSIDNAYKLADNEGSVYKASNNYIILHDVGTESKAWENASYLKRAWSSAGAYVQYYVGDGGKVFAGGAEGYQAWGAGTVANAGSPVQIELARTYDKAQFAKDYAAYVNLARNSAIKYGIPLTLDGAGRGIKTHLWVTNNIWGNHTDPYGYLARFGVTQQKLAHDLQTGLPEDGTATVPSNPAPTTSAPTTPSNSTIPAGFTPERGTFINGDTPIMDRVGGASVYNTRGEYLQPYASWSYDSYKRIGNLVWIHQVFFNGTRNIDVFIPVREGSYPWGTFK
ncbi:N-acetylmuramoyl-L-alanine amidase [Latilactobacillus curvatus]|uniref:N-acetylmuramoyl-L-alanine amidase n=1 Tax=Latilactobacillus curvatus TaxID=28038 RepID=UPI0020C76409|nr:N-acetylmuramoyl-L-alanine amidase [Latilactobacillus curvatus]MCP8858941.1 N-acetylmuramoyl-L-alanine amidase [Latilactobacillus curvatus]